MSEAEAIEIANRFLLKDRGVGVKPVEVVLVRRPNEPSFWWVSYGTGVRFPKETAMGAGVDGGEYILAVDDCSAEVRVLYGAYLMSGRRQGGGVGGGG